jgi:lysophospholipase L1-like esterase
LPRHWSRTLVNDVSAKRSLLPNLLLAAASLVFALLMAEVAIRVLAPEKFDTELLRAKLEENSVRALIEPSEDPELYYELQPDLQIDYRGSRVVTGPDRYRIADGPPSPKPADVRIALIGDSSSFGFRVDYEDSYPGMFRRHLERETGRRIELRNYSVPGYNAKQELQVFRSKVLPFEPDLLILHHDHNDAQLTGHGFPPTFIWPEYGDNPLHSALLKWALRRWQASRHSRGIQEGERENEFLDGYITDGPLYEDLLEARRALSDELRAAGVPAIAVIFNSAIRAEDDFETGERYLKLHKRMGDHLEGLGFYVLDLYPLYQSKLKEAGWSDLSEWWVDESDAHPNREGHRFIADALLAYTLGRPHLMRVFD